MLAVEDTFDFTIQFEEVVLAELHLFVLDLHSFFDTFLEINDNLVSSLLLNVLIDVEIGANCTKFDVVFWALRLCLDNLIIYTD